jgi:aryl-alcohol dehydrogenase-like predicted oxidoreductase
VGRKGQQIAIVGFPGLALMHYEQPKCTEALHRAYDLGGNYFDVAPAYGNGVAETRMGIGLQGLDRSGYFLSCKTKKRDKEGAREELERSLGVLKTEHFDLYQLHHLVTVKEVKQALGPGGAIETLVKAREEGKVRLLGFSAHTTKAAVEALNGFAFDTVMFPLSFVEYFRRGFGKEVVALAKEKGTAVIAIKPLCKGAWPAGAKKTREWWYQTIEEPKEVDLALRFTLSLPGVVSGIPPSFVEIYETAVAAARNYRPITASELADLEKTAQGCETIFQREEAMATAVRREAVFPDSPHEGCPGSWA